MTDDDWARRHRLLHRLWSNAVGTPDYDKREWRELEAMLLPSRPPDQNREGGAGEPEAPVLEDSPTASRGRN